MRIPSVWCRMQPLLRLTGLAEPARWLVFVWPLLWSMWVAVDGTPPLGQTVVLLFAFLLLRSAAVVLDRPGETLTLHGAGYGSLAPAAHGWLGLALLLGGVLLLRQLGPLPLILASVALLTISLYPFLRRRSHLAQLVLAIGYGVTIPALFGALGAEVARLAGLLGAVATLWAAAQVTILALGDRERASVQGYKSLATLYGDGAVGLVAVFQGLMFLALLLLGQGADAGPGFLAVIFLAAIVSAYSLLWLRKRVALPRVVWLQNAAGALVWIGLLVHSA